MNKVWVVNKTDQELSVQWNGVAYRIPVSAPTEISHDVAQNVLGYGLNEKFEFVVRLGWTKNSTDLPQALERLAKVEFHAERPQGYRASSPAVDRFPAPVLEKRERGKGTQAAA